MTKYRMTAYFHHKLATIDTDDAELAEIIFNALNESGFDIFRFEKTDRHYLHHDGQYEQLSLLEENGDGH